MKITKITIDLLITTLLAGVWVTGFIFFGLGIYTWYSWIFIILMFIISAIGLVYIAKILVERNWW